MATPSEATDRATEAQRLARALEALPNDQFLALSLKYLEGWPLDLIAQTMQASDFVVAGLLRHGVLRLVRPEEATSAAETVALPSLPDESIHAALADYLRSADSGGEPDRTVFLAHYPDLDEFFAAADRLGDLADLLRAEWTSRRTAPDADGDSLGDDPAPGPPAVVNIPGYVILGVLGRGGMGIVYKAVDLQLRRTVALKMLHGGSLAGRAERARFLTEAQAVARAHHPNIVQVFEVGEHAGLPYCALEYVPGGTLAARLAGPRVAGRWAAELVQTLARAVHFAHERHVIHRDLKPSNVLLAEDGSPKVADFGLAKLLDDDAGLTRGNAVVGTPSYMAPEQAEGKKDVGPPADVWALGAILYECLTGKPPFLGATPLETLRRVVTEEPIPVRVRNRSVARDLATIVHKCLDKDPARRYAGANELADDLGRFLKGDPVHARPAGWLRRTALGLKKNWGPVTVAASLALGLTAAWLTGTPVDPDRSGSGSDRVQVGHGPYSFPDEGALPGPFLQRYGPASSLTRTPGASHISVDTHSTVLWELAPELQFDRYEFRADVRHDMPSSSASLVGLYFGFRTAPPEGAGRRAKCFTLAFADGGPFAATNPDGTANSKAYLEKRYFDADAVAVPFGRLAIQTHDVANLLGKASPWRPLRVVVTPAGVTATWEPTAGQPRQVGTMTAAEAARALLPPVSQPQFADVPADYLPRAGVGLFVSRARASFRNVTLQPLGSD